MVKYSFQPILIIVLLSRILDLVLRSFEAIMGVARPDKDTPQKILKRHKGILGLGGGA